MLARTDECLKDAMEMRIRRKVPTEMKSWARLGLLKPRPERTGAKK